MRLRHGAVETLMEPHDIRSQGSRGWSCRVLLLAGLTLCGALQVADARQEAGQATKTGGLFASDEPLQITITAPWRELVRKKGVQTPYPATLEHADGSGQMRTLGLTVARRGISRQRVCDFPPIRLRFSGDTAKGSSFHGAKSLKMVTHCDKGERWEQYYVKEMLAYRIYNLVTERSFRVRPLSVTYRDSRTNARDGPHFAFLIEDDGVLAKRYGPQRSPLAEVSPTRLDAMESSRFALFQYLIGNTDWEVLSGPSGKQCCHNSVLIGRDAASGIYPVPYDFDSSGLVNADYAVPSPRIGIGSVTQRVYRGFCVHNAALEPARQEYLEKEQQIRDIFRNESRINPKNRKIALRYLDGFFDVLRNPDEFSGKVIAKCRK